MRLPALTLLLFAAGTVLSGCAVVAVTGAVVGAGVTVASTAVDVGVAAGKGVVYVGKAALGSDDDDDEKK
ncbi:hypothetical protein ACFFTM_06495 [Pseudoduganella plicata]|uniref:Lipoprotein n=1 Tax=Pseudoduganella plicata TaxID=321984 RepID=A0A4P7BJB2_9BURK|nr:hypothetical protein [Pseudoduganella plicata]QBQ38520.1 hypothetical protein E1742_21810 [Pseudoduganella plicata]GGY82720.1 hypothetical protein GCM10007388_14610 [Pseudoduganella plicata]